MSLSHEDAFNLEVLKLCLHVAWADDQIDQHEADMILGLGRSWTVPEAALQKLMEGIKAGRRPAEPDFEKLRERSDDALMAARALMLADGKAMPQEIDLLKRVAKALEG